MSRLAFLVKPSRVATVLASLLLIQFGSGAVAATPAAPVIRLADLEVVGILSLGTRVQVCIAAPGRQEAVWFTVGDEHGEMAVSAYDVGREAALVRLGGETRWIPLRQGRVTAMPVAHLPDGTIDWTHMNLSEKEKAREAEMLMWDILEVGRLARLGKLPPPATK